MADSIDTTSKSVDKIDAQSTPVKPAVRSPMPLSDWRGSVTTFKGFTGTKPVQELKHVEWDAITRTIAPACPAILEDKSLGKFFIPCALRRAPLVGNTLETALKNGEHTIGKMRSKSHVTEASFLVLDVDGSSEAEFITALEKLNCDGLTYLAYTTHSHGREDKPGMRVRLVIPLDRPLNTDEYHAAWHGFDRLYLCGHAGKADSSGANLYQQQGTWCAHPNRADLAECWSAYGGIASADSFIEFSGIVVTGDSDALQRTTRQHKAPPIFAHSSNIDHPTSDANKIADACQQIRDFRDTRGANQTEPIWFDCLGVVGFCKNGAEHCQEWSSGHPGYDERKTYEKLKHRLKKPPTTCAQLSKSNPAGCKGCMHECKSPITLGLVPAFDVEEMEVSV